VLAPGLLSGTAAPSSGRLSIGGKSPLTGTIKESNAGGQTGQYIARLGIAAVILEGWPKNRNDLYCIHISKEGATISAADELKGLGNYATVENIAQKYGEKIAVVSIGQDTMETGAAIGVAMEAGVIPFGDSDAVENLVKEIGRGTPMGRIIASGTAVTGQAFGVYRVPVVKNQGIPSYEPRAIKGIGVTYATSTMGADHTAGYVVGANLAGVVDPLKPEGQAPLSKKIQTIAAMLFDSTGLCLFCHRPTSDNPEALKAIIGMINAALGVSLGQEDIFAQGRKTLQTEWEFNKKAGFTNAHDRLPEFMTTEPIPSQGTVFDVSTQDLDSVMDFET